MRPMPRRVLSLPPCASRIASPESPLHLPRPIPGPPPHRPLRCITVTGVAAGWGVSRTTRSPHGRWRERRRHPPRCPPASPIVVGHAPLNKRADCFLVVDRRFGRMPRRTIIPKEPCRQFFHDRTTVARPIRWSNTGVLPRLESSFMAFQSLIGSPTRARTWNLLNRRSATLPLNCLGIGSGGIIRRPPGPSNANMQPHVIPRQPNDCRRSSSYAVACPIWSPS